jgi:hypothetical protein
MLPFSNRFSKTLRSAQPTHLGEAVSSRINSFNTVLLFPEKEAKSVSSASQKTTLCSNLGEAD